jgi:hypothetical protein
MFAILAVLMTATIAVFPVFAGTSDINSGNGLESSIITSVPRTMSYQGILKDSGGDPAVDSVYSVTFRIYDAESGGTSEWTEILPCTTSEGYFTALFSNVNIPFDEDYWLELDHAKKSPWWDTPPAPTPAITRRLVAAGWMTV